MKEKEDFATRILQATTESQKIVVALEAEAEAATKDILDLEEKVVENEAKVARLIGEQASLKLDCLNLKRKQLEKSSQLREARVSLKELEDKNRQAQAELVATLCGKALVVSKQRFVLCPTADSSLTPAVQATAEAVFTPVVPEPGASEEASTPVVPEPGASEGASTPVVPEPGAAEAAAKPTSGPMNFISTDLRRKDRLANLKLPANFQQYMAWTVTQKDKVGSSMGSKDPNLGRVAGRVYEELAEVSLRLLEVHPTMGDNNRIHIRKEAMGSSFRALDNFACAKMWSSFQRVLDLVDRMSWGMTPEESAELNVVRLRIDIVNGDRAVAEVTAKNTLDQAKANRWRGVVAAASSVLSSIAWHNSHGN